MSHGTDVLNIYDFGKIINDMNNLAESSYEPCWFIEDKNEYTKSEWEEFERDYSILNKKYPNTIEFTGDPYITFYGSFLTIFHDKEWLDKNNYYGYENNYDDLIR